MTGHREGGWRMGTIGLGNLSAYSRKRIPSPPQKMTTFMGAFSLGSVRRTNQSRIVRSRVNLNLRDRHDELASPIPNACILLHDFLFEIPRQDQQIIRPCTLDLIRWINGNVCPRQELAVLMGIAVDGIVDEVGADGAIIQQGVALARSTISGNLLSTALGLDKKFEQFALGFLHLVGKARVRLYLRVPQFFLSFAKISDP